MTGYVRFVKSSIGSKLLMAVTGVILLLFVIGHMLGNLQIFLGQDALNTYAEKLRGISLLLWIVRISLLVITLIHIVTSLRLSWLNRQARSLPYVYKNTVQATLASRTMLYSGLLVLAFVLYHLMHFTWGITNPEYSKLLDPKGRPDVYSMVVLSFRNLPVSITYIIAMILLWFHLSHGGSSVFQTLGVSQPKYHKMTERVGPILATIIVAGNISIPFFILLGVVKPFAGGMP